MLRTTIAVAAALAALCAAPPGRAADFPTKPITLMIGFAPGGPSDVLARIVTRKMEEILKQPFRGPGPALQNVIAGHVPMAFNPPPPLLPHIQSGAIRPLAVTTLKRTSALPDVPTVAESGFPGFDATTWHALVAPAGTPKE